MSNIDNETREMISQLADEYMSYRSVEMEAKNLKEAVGEQLKALLGEETEFHTPNAHIIYKTIESRVVDTKTMKQCMPELISKFEKVRETRPLKIA